jgi:AcrR family transcriptional regulator
MSRHTRTRTRLDPERRRESILDAAEQVLHGRDPAEVTFEEIADAAEVSRALVYNYFGDRNGLLSAVYVRSFERLDDELLGSLDPGDDPARHVGLVARGYLDFARRNLATWRLMAMTAAVPHPDVQRVRRRRFERLATIWGDTDQARIAAQAVAGMLEVATGDWLEDDVDPDLAVDTIATMLGSGLDPALRSVPVAT